MVTKTQEELMKQYDIPESDLPSRIPDETTTEPRGMLTEEKPMSRKILEGFIEAAPEVGSVVAAGLFSRFYPPGAPAIKRFSGEAISAMIGGMTGQKVKEVASGEKIDGKQSAYRAVQEGLENAVIDFSGNLIFSSGGKVFKVTKDILKKYGHFRNTPMSPLEDIRTVAQDIIQKEGGTLTKYQVSGDGLDSVIELIARFGYTGMRTMRENDAAIQRAVQKYRDKTLNDVSKLNLSSEQFGIQFDNYIKDGYTNLKNVVRPFYEKLDDYSKGVSVDFKPIKQKALTELNRIAKRADPESKKMLGVSSKLRNLYEEIASSADTMNFSTAHGYKSDLYDRILEVKAEVKGTKAEGYLKNVISDITEAMDLAAKKVDNEKLFNEYTATSAFYKESVENLFGDALQAALRQNPEKVGETIFAKGNVTNVKEAFTAIDRSSNLAKEAGVPNAIEEGLKIKQALKRGYLEAQIKNVGVEFTQESINNLTKNILKAQDPQDVRTFQTVLSSKEQKDFIRLLKVANISAQKPMGSSLSLFLAGKQAGAINAFLTAVPGFSAGGNIADALSVASFLDPIAKVVGATATLMTPKVFARISTNPKAVNKIIAAEKALQQGRVFTPGVMSLIVDGFREAGVNPSDWLTEEPKEEIEIQKDSDILEENERILKEKYGIQ